MIFDFERGFNDDESLSLGEKSIIAISANIIDENSAIHFAYTQALVDAGAIPVLVPANCDIGSIIGLIRGVDGLLLSGGADIDARYFNQENIPGLTDIMEQRDYYEFMLLRAAIDHGVPVFGICRGCQLINVALGGSLYQDLPSLYPQKPLEHSVLTNKHLPVHDIEIAEDSMLYKIIGKRTLAVNSRHHQAIDVVAPSLKVSATSTDGVIEGVEAYPSHKIIALQCHPENLATTGASADMKRLFSFFVSEANLYRLSKRIHSLNPIVDSHCDTPMLYDTDGFNFAIRNRVAQVDAVKMKEGCLDATITVAYISQRTPSELSTEKAFSTLARFRADVAKLADVVTIASGPSDVLRAKAKGLKCVMLGVENGYAIGSDISNIDRFKHEGVVYITLCHNGSNDICDSAIGDSIHDGVSTFGRDVIARMNKLGVTVDVSHSSEKSTLDAIELSSQPIIASHSSCKALFNHPRNLSDSAIKAVAQCGGVVQICSYGGFLSEDGKATIHTLIEHIEHVVALVGYDYVGVGSDFDGGGGIEGFNGANDFVSLTVELLRRGHSDENIAKIMGGNILRVLSSNFKG